jgi:putative endonuclease
MFYVYVLISLRDRKLYVGFTGNLEKRIKEHNAGKSSSTKDRLPVELIYYEVYITKHEAERREKFLKGGNGRDQLKIQLSETLKMKGYKYM